METNGLIKLAFKNNDFKTQHFTELEAEIFQMSLFFLAVQLSRVNSEGPHSYYGNSHSRLHILSLEKTL